MTTARSIIEGALTFHLNRLSPGETLDADLAEVCLTALNFIADEMNGSGSFLFREILTNGTVTSATGTLGTTWSTLSPGEQILGATYTLSSQQFELMPLDMAQYANIAVKTTAGYPQYYAPDGLATIYFYPVPTSTVVTLRTKQEVSDFADLDTDYSMPSGYKSGLAAKLAKALAPVLLGGITPAIASASNTADTRLVAQSLKPAILNARRVGGNITNDE